MTILKLANIPFEFQQVSTPIDTEEEDENELSDKTQLNKEDFLAVHQSPSNFAKDKKITGRSIYIGNRDAFFQFIGQKDEEIKQQLMPKEQIKRLD